MEGDNRKPYKIKDITRNIKKAVVAATLEEIKIKSAEKFDKLDVPNIHLDSDGTEIDDEDYFQTLEANAELIAVFPGEQWIDPTHYVTITTRRDSADMTDGCDVEKIHLKKLVGQLKNNLCSVSVLSEPDLELLSNMDPNSLTDITGKDFIEQLKEASGRILYEKRQALDAIELLKLFAKHKGILLNESSTTTIFNEIADGITTDVDQNKNIPTTSGYQPQEAHQLLLQHHEQDKQQQEQQHQQQPQQTTSVSNILKNEETTNQNSSQ